MSARVSAVTVDCHDPARLAAFWGSLLGRSESPSLPGWRQLGTGEESALRINFQPVSAPKAAKNRLHLDVTVDDMDQAVRLVVSLGGAETAERHDYPEGVVVVMHDPEYNEFCLVQYYG
jgi:predicted enzyme related to lactoylglutathione lyase